MVPDLVGWPRDQRDDLIAWGGATFDVLGPLNGHAAQSDPRSSCRCCGSRAASCVGARVSKAASATTCLAAADDGKLPHRDCPPLMVDYIAPSLDTTISAISNALYLFATHPRAMAAPRETTPTLIPNAVNEVVRYESPLRAFSRKAAREKRIGGTNIPTGSRVLVIYASANRDEREWDQPDAFDIRRDATRQLGFGHGSHACAGQGLARMETQAMLRALVQRVERIELAAPPTWAVNNIIRRHERLPLKLIAA